MLEAQKIDHSVSRDPTFSKIIDQFLSAMNFMEEIQEIEAHCVTLLRVLQDVGGPCIRASERLRSQLIEEINNKLRIKFNIDLA